MTKHNPSRYFRFQRFLMDYRHIVASLGIMLVIFGIVNLISAYLDTYPILVTTKTVETGEELNESNVHIIKIPTKNVPSNLVNDISVINGRIACIDIPSGAPIVTSMTRNPISSPKDNEVVAVPVDPRSMNVMQPGANLQLYGYQADCDNNCEMQALDFSAKLVSFQPFEDASQASTSKLFSDDDVQLIEVAVPRGSVEQLINSALKAPLYATVQAEN